jgi:hypothetical protein
MRRSIEVEYWVIDDEGRLTAPGTLVDASPGAEQEFVEPILEIKTTPCETFAELRTVLLDRIHAVLQRADDLGMGLVPIATSMTPEDIRERPGARTRIQNRVFGDSFPYVRHCAGTHMHFEQQTGATIDQLNTLIALDPALALVNSARHFRGRPLCVGARSRLYRRMAYRGFPHQGRLWAYVADRAEWDRRLRACYDAFCTRARDAGTDPSTLESCFDPRHPESAAWTPVKLRSTFGTVEWRSPDTALPSQILRLADTMGTILDRVPDTPVRIGDGPAHVNDREIALPAFDTVMGHVDAAIEAGLSSNALRSYLRRMGFAVNAYAPIADTSLPDTPISPAESRQLRLDYARRLREDVARARSPNEPVPPSSQASS